MLGKRLLHSDHLVYSVSHLGMFLMVKEFFFENAYELLGVKEFLGISTIDPRMSSNISLSEAIPRSWE